MIAQEVLKPEGSQELKRLLRGRILTPDDGFMGLQTAHREKKLQRLQGQLICQNTRKTTRRCLVLDFK